MSLDDYYGDDDDGRGSPWEDAEWLDTQREYQFQDRMEQMKLDREFLIAKLDKERSWTLAKEYLAFRERENGRPVSKEDDMDQEWNEFLRYKLRLPGNLKAYLLYQFLLVRDFGVCACIVASLYTITGLVIKFLPYLTRS